MKRKKRNSDEEDETFPSKAERVWEYVEQLLVMTPEQRECYVDSIEELLEAGDIVNEILTGQYAETGN